jgi:hypothetical protein
MVRDEWTPRKVLWFLATCIVCAAVGLATGNTVAAFCVAGAMSIWLIVTKTRLRRR